MFQGVLADVLDFTIKFESYFPTWDRDGSWPLERSLAQISLTNTWYRWSATWTTKQQHCGDAHAGYKVISISYPFHPIYPLDTQWTLEVHSWKITSSWDSPWAFTMFLQVVKLTNDPVPNVRFNAAKTILVRVLRLHNAACNQNEDEWRTERPLILVDPFIAIHSHSQTLASSHLNGPGNASGLRQEHSSKLQWAAGAMFVSFGSRWGDRSTNEWPEPWLFSM